MLFRSQQQELEMFVSRQKLENVSFTGKKLGGNLKKVVAASRFVVVPSEWYDNSPLVIYESFSMAKPVIGADMGGISELIDDGENGFLFRAGNAEELSRKIGELWNDLDKVVQFGENALKKAQNEFSPEVHYKKIMQLYEVLYNG